MIDKTSEKPQKLLISLSVVISLSFSIIVAEWVLRYQHQSIDQNITSSERMDPGMILYDAQLGWKLKPYWTGKHHHYDYDVVYNIDSNGFRDSDTSFLDGDYAVVGDSFSFGLGVDDDETFTALLNAASNQRSSFKNYSVPGYSTDQQLLLINKLKDEISHKIILVVYLGNDIFDNMREYPLQAEYGKPYFKLNNDQLSLKNTPVPLASKPAAARKESITSIVLGNDIRSNTFTDWMSRLEISRRLKFLFDDEKLSESEMESRFSESLKVFKRLVYEIEKRVNQYDQPLIVVLLPGRSYVEQPGSLSAQYQEFFRQDIKSSLQARSGIKVLDLAAHLRVLDEKGIKNLYYPNEGHLTPSGHQRVADYLLMKL